MAEIITRQTDDPLENPGVTNKGEPLTNEELDLNFINLNNAAGGGDGLIWAIVFGGG